MSDYEDDDISEGNKIIKKKNRGSKTDKKKSKMSIDFGETFT